MCHHLLKNKEISEETKLSLFEQSFNYIQEGKFENNTLQHFLRQAYYDALLSPDSGQLILQKIFEQQKYSQHLTFQELSLLLSVLKELKLHPEKLTFMTRKLEYIHKLNL